MQYENPQPEEGINYSQENPLIEFGQLILGVLIVVAVVIAILNFMAASLAKYIPFEYEQKMISQFDFLALEISPRQQYLQALADRLIPHMDLPEDITITVHYSDAATINAFATLGGNLLFYKGLLDRIESEDELATVMAHEIAHIKYRHPMVAMGKGVTIASLAAAISGFSGSSSGEWLLGSSANLSLMRFSRAQESEADALAAEAIQQLYGHIQGAQELFENFAELEGAKTAIKKSRLAQGAELFRSHPYSGDRWLALKANAEREVWATAGELTPLELPD